MNNVNKNFYSYFYLNLFIIMLDSEFMNLQDDFRPNNNFSCWPNDSFIEICLVQSRVKKNERASYAKRNSISNKTYR